MTAPTLMEKLSLIQCELKAPKNQYNQFGNYYYRSCEDILEAVKPLCNKQKTTLIISDEIVCVDGWHYIKAIARLHDWESGEVIENVAYARESVSKKGMDDSQVTGSTSTYARKYALNGLFNIDDTKDNDSPDLKKEQAEKAKKDEPTQQASKPPKEKDDMGKMLMEYKECQRKLADLGVDIRSENIKQWMSHYTGYPDQEASLDDYDKMRKLIMAYNTLIRGKEQANG